MGDEARTSPPLLEIEKWVSIAAPLAHGFRDTETPIHSKELQELRGNRATNSKQGRCPGERAIATLIPLGPDGRLLSGVALSRVVSNYWCETWLKLVSQTHAPSL